MCSCGSSYYGRVLPGDQDQQIELIITGLSRYLLEYPGRMSLQDITNVVIDWLHSDSVTYQRISPRLHNRDTIDQMASAAFNDVDQSHKSQTVGDVTKMVGPLECANQCYSQQMLWSRRFQERFPIAMKSNWKLQHITAEHYIVTSGDHHDRGHEHERTVSWAGMKIHVPDIFWEDEDDSSNDLADVMIGLSLDDSKDVSCDNVLETIVEEPMASVDTGTFETIVEKPMASVDTGTLEKKIDDTLPIISKVMAEKRIGQLIDIAKSFGITGYSNWKLKDAEKARQEIVTKILSVCNMSVSTSRDFYHSQRELRHVLGDLAPGDKIKGLKTMIQYQMISLIFNPTKWSLIRLEDGLAVCVAK
jgi:hypothetical protein